VRIGAAGADELLCGAAGAEQQYRHRGCAGGTRPQRVVAEQAVRKARTAQGDDQQTPLNERNRARHGFQSIQGEDQGYENQDGDACRFCDIQQIHRRGVTPDASIHPEPMEGDACNGHKACGHSKDSGRLQGEHGVAQA
jgi:hypothetical protein